MATPSGLQLLLQVLVVALTIVWFSILPNVDLAEDSQKPNDKLVSRAQKITELEEEVLQLRKKLHQIDESVSSEGDSPTSNTRILNSHPSADSAKEIRNLYRPPFRKGLGEHETAFTAIVGGMFREQDLVPRGSVIDAGAQFGELAAAVAALSPERTVYAVEPSPQNCQSIRDHFGAHLPNLRVITAGLGEREGILEAAKAGSFGQVPKSDLVQIETLDSLFANKKERLGFAHLDVEGLELQVLRGGIQTLTNDRPIVTTELQVHRNATYSQELLGFWDQHGYDTYLLDEVCGSSMDLRNLINVPRELSISLAYSDTFNLAMAAEVLFRVTVNDIAQYAYPCCAPGNECCQQGQDTCCSEAVVMGWLERNEKYQIQPMLSLRSFKHGRRETTKRWWRLRQRTKKDVELGT